MTFSEYLGTGISLFFHPFQTLGHLAGIYQTLPRKRILSLAVLSLLFGSLSATLSGMIVNGGGMSGNAGTLILMLIYAFAASLLSNVMLMAVYYFCLNFLSAEPRGLETLVGLFLAPELLSIILLPAAILSRVLGGLGDMVYGLTAFAVLVLTVVLKIRALSLSARWSGGRSVLVFVLPYAVMVVFGILSVIHLAGLFVQTVFR